MSYVFEKLLSDLSFFYTDKYIFPFVSLFFSSGASMSLQSFFAKPFKRDFNAYV